MRRIAPPESGVKETPLLRRPSSDGGGIRYDVPRASAASRMSSVRLPSPGDDDGLPEGQECILLTSKLSRLRRTPSPVKVRRGFSQEDLICSSSPFSGLSHLASRKSIVLVSCGSFNPPTFAHIRMFELAKDHLQRLGLQVLGGYLSPVNDGYQKPGLIESRHRVEMCRLALRDNSWVEVADWETRQTSYARTRIVLEGFRQFLQGFFGDRAYEDKVRLSLLCGADYLRSFIREDVWTRDDVEFFGRNGLVVVEREGVDLEEIVLRSDVLSMFSGNIISVAARIRDDISSTAVRRLVQRKCSTKHIVSDEVRAYIDANELYREPVHQRDDASIEKVPMTQADYLGEIEWKRWGMRDPGEEVAAVKTEPKKMDLGGR